MGWWGLRGLGISLVLCAWVVGLSVVRAQDETLNDNDRYAWMRAVGKHGAVVASSDAGLTWSITVLDGQPDLMDVSFLDARNGYVVGAQSSVFFTANAGLQWNKAEIDSIGGSETLEGVFMSGNPGPVYIVGQNGLYMFTEDGESWGAWRIRCPAGSASGADCPKADYSADLAGVSYPTLFSVRFKDSINGIVVGDEALVLITNDSGETFTKLEPLQTPLPSGVLKRPALKSIAMDFLGNMTVAGDNGLVFVVTPLTRFSDDTVTFSWKACNVDGTCNSDVPVSVSSVSVTNVGFRSSALINDHVMAGGEGTLLAINHEAAWKTLKAIGDSGDNITGIYFSTPDTGVVVTQGGKIYRTSSTINNGEFQKIELTDTPVALSFAALAGRNADDVAGTAERVGRHLKWKLLASFMLLLTLLIR